MDTITIGRGPVLTLWAAVVAIRLGFDRQEALSLGKALAGITPRSTGIWLGLFDPVAPSARQRRQAMVAGDKITVDLMGIPVPAVVTPEGIRATNREGVCAPAPVDRYLAEQFRNALPKVTAAMGRLAASRPPAELARQGFKLYLEFRPAPASDATGRDSTGTLELAKIDALVRRSS